MKPHPRIRKTIKWGGAALPVLMVAVWIGSGWYYFGYYGARGFLRVNNGTFQLASNCGMEGMERGRWFAGPGGGGWFWKFSLISSNPGCWHAMIPLWAIIAPSLFLTALAFRLNILARRRARMNLCPNCHYDRTGLAAGAVCPECGSAAL